MSDGLILQIVVPLLSAPVCLLLRNGTAAGILSALVSVFTFCNALLLLNTVMTTGSISYLLGGVEIPYGIEYRLDLLNAYVLVMVSAITMLTTVYAAATYKFETAGGRPDLFFACWQLAVTGLLGITVTGDVFNVFVFLEISSLSSYVLVAHGRRRKALVAAFRYLLVGTIGATFLLIGIGLLYMATGTLNMGDLALRLPAVAESGAVRAAFAFVTVGLCLKAAVFPLHMWLPSAYACAPSSVSALLAGTATKVALYLWMRFFFTIFAPSVTFASLPVDDLLLPLGLIGALAGSLVAVFRNDPKRMLAWSSLAQIGYMILGLSLGSHAGLTAMLSHLLNHAVIKTALFLALGLVVLRLGVADRPLRMTDLHGLSKSMPWTAAAIVIGGLSLIGMPLTAGFVSKWLLISALLEQGLWIAVVLILFSSLLAVVYVWRLVEAMYFQPPGTVDPSDPRIPVPLNVWMVWPLWVLIAACVGLGVYTDLNVALAGQAVTALMQSGVGR